MGKWRFVECIGQEVAETKISVFGFCFFLEVKTEN